MMCFLKAVTSITLQPFPMVQQDHTLVAIYQYSNELVTVPLEADFGFTVLKKKKVFKNHQKI